MEQFTTETLRYREQVLNLLSKHRLLEDVVRKQDMQHHELVETLVRKQNLAQLQGLLRQLGDVEITEMLTGLPQADQLLLWAQLDDGKKESVLRTLPIEVLLALGEQAIVGDYASIHAFELHEGRLRQFALNNREQLAQRRPVWIDLVAPSFEERLWAGALFGIELPDPEQLNDLESSARFYVEENGEIHLHSNFLLDRVDESRNVAVAFILYHDILFSVRSEELPVFRLQRMRTMTQANYVTDARDVLLDLYAGDVEYSAGALEDVYRDLALVGKQVLSKQMSDEEAARTLVAIANEEDLNGRIRGNVLDTRRAVSFLMRSKLLEKNQLEDTQQILRDIESLDGHTTFLFGKINFLMDTTVGFININQNKVVKRLTVLSVVFMPLNVLAGIGGMSEFSMMTQGISWPLSYSLFTIGLVLVGYATFVLLRVMEKREYQQAVKGREFN
jgi:magnesium transporter